MIILKHLKESHVDELLSYRLRNKDFFKSFEPTRNDDFFTSELQLEFINNAKLQAMTDQLYLYGIFNNDSLIGLITLSSVSRGPFQSAYLGYSIDKNENNKGYVTKAIGLLKEISENELSLHRIQAAVMLRNIASIKALEKNGFHKIGFAKRYLKINNVWEDHFLYEIILEK